MNCKTNDYLKQRAINTPDGDPGKVCETFIALAQALSLVSSSRKRAIAQLKAWAVIETQRRIAEKLGITPQYLSDVLNGRRGVCDAFCHRVIRAMAQDGR